MCDVQYCLVNNLIFSFICPQIDGKLLCWLCTSSYKRALAKARQVDRITKKRPNNDKQKNEMNMKKPQRPDISKQLLPDIPEKVARIANHGIIIDTNSSDHVIAMTELKEKIASLQKKVVQKDRDLLDKDKLITELKARNFTAENELRTRMKDTESFYETKVDILNKKVASLLREIAALTRSNKKGGPAAQTVSKDSGGSGTDSPITN